MTFIEMGCNAGMFLKLAKAYGFKNVIGVEKDQSAYKTAKKYLGDGYELINAELTEKFDYDLLPAADVIVLANFHYHVFLPAFMEFVNRMRRKARYVIVVSTRVRTTRHFPNGRVDDIRHYFRHWEEVGYIPPLSSSGDPKPRTVWSLAFKSELVRRSIKDIKDKMGKTGRYYYNRIMDKTGKYKFTNPLIAYPEGRIIDGTHRLINLEREGYKTAIVEPV